MKIAVLNKFLLIFTFFVFFQENYILAQNQKAIDLFEKASQQLSERKTSDATQTLLKVIEIEPKHAAAYFKLGQIAESNQGTDKATTFYKKAIELRPDDKAFIQAFTFLGTRYLKAGDFEKAKDYLSFSKKNISPNAFINKQLDKQLAICHFAIEAQKKPLLINATEVDKVLNIQNHQYFPILSPDNESLIFTARAENGDEDLYISKQKNGVWTSPESISPNINTIKNEGTCSISADGRTLVFTSCDNEHGMGSCDLYISKKTGNEWNKPVNLGGQINSRYWESQPSLSNDGRVLYFSSDRPLGFGRKDLYKSSLDDNGLWTKAENLGNIINTISDEISPFIHANNQTLFFASDGLIGMGGFDIFMAEKTENGYKTPENLGFPINTPDDQVAMIFSADGKKAFYSLTEKRNTKLYQFDVPPPLNEKFKRANLIKGVVKDAQSKKPLQANIELYDLKSNALLSKIRSDSLTGEYTAILPNGTNYALYVNKKGYFFKSLSFDFIAQKDAQGKLLDINLEAIRKDAKEVLNNIFFDSGRADIKIESITELDKLQKLLKQNPMLMIEISGHTDDVGKDADNQILSYKRAQAVVDYLTKNGANTLKLKALGYGENKPFVPNTNDENRRLNRRIEMRIL